MFSDPLKMDEVVERFSISSMVYLCTIFLIIYLIPFLQTSDW